MGFCRIGLRSWLEEDMGVEMVYIVLKVIFLLWLGFGGIYLV